MLRASRAHPNRPLRIVNRSGLSGGHQDFAICAYLHKQKVPFEWLAVEHPSSPPLDHPLFKALVQRNGIQIVLLDLGQAQVDQLQERAGASFRHWLLVRLARWGIALGEAAWRWPTLQGALKTLGELIVIEARLSERKPEPFAL